MPSGYVSNCDALLFLGSLRDGVADVVFLDPPFNLGKDYGRHAHLETANPDAYDIYMRSVLRESVPVLRAGGALFLSHLPTWAIRFAPYLSDRLEFRHWIAIAMKNGFARGDRLYPAHYALLYFTRGKDRKSTRLNSSHMSISYAVFCLKKKKKNNKIFSNKKKNKKKKINKILHITT